MKKSIVPWLVAIALIAMSLPSTTAIAEDEGVGKRQKVVVHLSHFTDDLHRCFMAVKVASLLQEFGADVTMFLDLEGVRLAARQQTLDLRWGASESPLSEHYDKFAAGGGKLVLCPHCARAARLNDPGLKREAEIGTEKRIAEMLLEADKVIDY